MKEDKVLKVEISKDRSCSCNACFKRVMENQSDSTYVAKEVYDIILGNKRHCVVIRLCDECLNEFADVLWQSLESEEN